MPYLSSPLRLIVKSTLFPLSNGGFYFDAERDGKSVLCMSHAAFEGERPRLSIGDKIIATFGSWPPAFESSSVIYVTKLEGCRESPPGPGAR